MKRRTKELGPAPPQEVEVFIPRTTVSGIIHVVDLNTEEGRAEAKASAERAARRRKPRKAKPGTRATIESPKAARAYVERVLSSAIAMDLEDENGWLLGGLEHPADVSRVTKAAKSLARELSVKGSAA